jgi:DNA repair photolyase
MSECPAGSGDHISPVGRGAQITPPNRFERLHVDPQFDQVEHDEDFVASRQRPQTLFLSDDAQSIVSQNSSPDIPFRYSLNCYRGCIHGCSYCYARPTHEYLGFSAGLDFETRILVKQRGPQLLREFLSDPKWKPEPIMMSGVTDCYQPVERHFRLTRACFEVALEAQQPILIVTKNALIERDLDILSEMAAANLVHVSISLTSLDQSLTRLMEPRTSCPEARLRAISRLSQAGVPVGVLLAPLVPGLTDDQIPGLLRAAKEHGAVSASYTLLRLPLSVQGLFLDWLKRSLPERYERVEGRIRALREGELNQSEFGTRMHGSGIWAEQIRQLFQVFSKPFGIDQALPELDCSRFTPPRPASGQLMLF